jgi:hypothetical protein
MKGGAHRGVSIKVRQERLQLLGVDAAGVVHVIVIEAVDQVIGLALGEVLLVLDRDQTAGVILKLYSVLQGGGERVKRRRVRNGAGAGAGGRAGKRAGEWSF